MKRPLTLVASLFLVSSLLHLGWETSHVGLYGGYEDLTTVPITLWATIGDVVYTFIAFSFVAVIKRNPDWLEGADGIDFGVVSFIGFCIALFVEYKALALDRWYYLDAMPIIPALHVGLSPVVQMTLLLPASFYLSKELVRRISAD